MADLDILVLFQIKLNFQRHRMPMLSCVNLFDQQMEQFKLLNDVPM